MSGAACKHEWSEDYVCETCGQVRLAAEPYWARVYPWKGRARGARAVWLALWTCADTDTTEPRPVFAGNALLAERCGGLTKRAVQGYLRTLQEMGWIRRVDGQHARDFKLAWGSPRADWATEFAKHHEEPSTPREEPSTADEGFSTTKNPAPPVKNPAPPVKNPAPKSEESSTHTCVLSGFLSSNDLASHAREVGDGGVERAELVGFQHEPDDVAGRQPLATSELAVRGLGPGVVDRATRKVVEDHHAGRLDQAIAEVVAKSGAEWANLLAVSRRWCQSLGEAVIDLDLKPDDVSDVLSNWESDTRTTRPGRSEIWYSRHRDLVRGYLGWSLTRQRTGPSAALPGISEYWDAKIAENLAENGGNFVPPSEDQYDVDEIWETTPISV